MAPALLDEASTLLALAERLPGFLLRNAAAEWKFYLLMAVALGIGVGIDLRRRRARRRYLSAGFRTDLTYAAVELSHVVQLLVLVPLTSGLNHFLESAAPWLEADLALPVWLELLLLFVFLDFWTYWYHRALHSNRYLWQFHKVHHSQSELSAFSNFRVSLLDRMVNIAALSVPTFMIGGNYALPLLIVLLIQFHQLIVHIDVDWRSGWLGRLIVLPSFHVTHHSTAPGHANRNFGGVLSVWDRLFGSAAERGPGELEFGLTDERVPEGYLRQLLVPVAGLCGELRKDLERLRPPLADAVRP
jgi:sterol desaturase/sphingolipid hydroxylase (fatty acid hydroxylase superfamily)